MLALFCRCLVVLGLLLSAAQPAPALVVMTGGPQASCCSSTHTTCPKAATAIPNCCVAAASPLFAAPVGKIYLVKVQPCRGVAAADVFGASRTETPPLPPPKVA